MVWFVVVNTKASCRINDRRLISIRPGFCIFSTTKRPFMSLRCQVVVIINWVLSCN